MADTAVDTQAADDAELGTEQESEIQDTTLRGLFNDAGGVDEEEEAAAGATEGDTTEAQRTPPVVEQDTETTSRLTSLEEELQALRDERTALRTENQILKMRTDPPEEEETGLEVDFDELNKEIAENPAKAIAKLINTLTPQIEKRVIKQAEQHSTSAINHARSADADVSKARATFGDLPLTNKEFYNRAAQIYDELTANSPIINDKGTRYHPGAVYSSMEMAYGQLVREGKIKPDSNGKVSNISERRKPPISPRLGNGSDTAETRPNNPLAGMSPREIAVARRVAKEMGVPWEQYVKRMSKLRAADPNYGGFK